ncbi:septal ring lytic transglycosylase RlpA family protein [Herbaspirillum sp. RTI4]|uniref:septal ring lytic transglycosylase RlpA family protein n=1 Tax=Herbaspirillum sp. RTI4 TaxID=3048640 RepID=UPI002AB41A0F|nr:septal ring lytic transglycosylase RlpA family protein [Herbaspirillum sp. RTI4]MDY7577442.1 septal ring lytic transglycosylase RlpA family protein [Herbaspirillum sp. RTI4]MEA9981718.1 septal ring lytic transglycosylase RlpA family protein [Herbaspirillum sp. RTI4]
MRNPMRNPFCNAAYLLRPLAALLVLALAACSSAPNRPAPPDATGKAGKSPSASTGRTNPALPAAGSGRGGYYLDDGPGDKTPEGLMDTPDAEPRIEPYSKSSGRPYVVFGKTYTPLMDEKPFKQRGIGSWYGKKFHGQKTSSGEPYDMYKMTAAHPTLPIPSYAKVTNLKTGAQIIVRVNDRGPFHSSRIIDLSYTAALKLGYLSNGSSELEVERLLPDDITQILADKKAGRPVLMQASAAEQGATMEAVSTSRIETQGLMDAPADKAAPALVAGGSQSMQAAAVPGFYLQFGAFSQENNAEAAKGRLELGLSGIVDHMQTMTVNGVYRLYAGPYASRGAAQEAAQQIRQRGVVTPFIVER